MEQNNMKKREENVWDTSVTELIQIFRDATASLIPFMERAKIPWKEQEAYDQWDDIETSLYRGIVLSALNWIIGHEGFDELAIPDYNFLYDDYSKFSFLGLLSDEAEKGIQLVFHSLSTTEVPFDTARFLQVNSKGKRVSDNFVVKPLRDTKFALNLRVDNRAVKTLSNIQIHY
jgi:hypothetical protein